MQTEALVSNELWSITGEKWIDLSIIELGKVVGYLENNEVEKTSLCVTSNIFLSHLKILVQICVICLILRVCYSFIQCPRNESYGFSVVMYGCESWTIKKAEI